MVVPQQDSSTVAVTTQRKAERTIRVGVKSCKLHWFLKTTHIRSKTLLVCQNGTSGMGAYAGTARRRVHLVTILLRPPSGHRPGRRQARHALILLIKPPDATRKPVNTTSAWCSHSDLDKKESDGRVFQQEVAPHANRLSLHKPRNAGKISNQNLPTKRALPNALNFTDWRLCRGPSHRVPMGTTALLSTHCSIRGSQITSEHFPNKELNFFNPLTYVVQSRMNFRELQIY